MHPIYSLLGLTLITETEHHRMYYSVAEKRVRKTVTKVVSLATCERFRATSLF